MKQQQRSEGENEPEHAPNQHWPCARVAEHGRNRHRRENRAHAQSCDYRQRHNQRGRARRTRRHAATLARVLETFLTESRAAPTRLGGRARVAETPSHDAHHQMRKSRRFVHQHPELPHPDLRQLDIGIRHSGQGTRIRLDQRTVRRIGRARRRCRSDVPRLERYRTLMDDVHAVSMLALREDDLANREALGLANSAEQSESSSGLRIVDMACVPWDLCCGIASDHAVGLTAG